jgi:DNA-directed RNA polymerase subunit L
MTMKIKALKRDNQELRLELGGEGHSFCNALQYFLLHDDAIDFAGYNIQHPLVGNPVVYLRTKRKRPENALRDATRSLDRTLDELQKTFQKALAGEERSTNNNED